jgi:hypothetical protein
MGGNANNFQWDHEHVRRIRKEKEKYRGDKDKENLFKMVTESVYSEETHYVLELIQNAEDEGAKGITFTITNDLIIVENDGKPFSADDVFSICSAGQSRKENKIGFFGIGFKSVFNITKNPQVISGKYNFLISEYIYPETTNEVPDSIESFDQSRGAFFVLPINVKKGLNEKRLAKGLYEVNERLMLFLQSLERIVLNDMTGEEGKTWEIRKEYLGGGFVRIVNTGTGLTSTWKVFRKTVRVPPNKEIRVKGKEKAMRSTVVIAFPHPDEDTDVKAEKIYCFLPTKTRTDLPFLIQADFIPTLGRESIEKNEWNRWLLKKLGELAAESFLEMREDALFSKNLYDFIPLPDEVLEEMIKIVPETILTKLRKKQIAACEGTWEKVQDAVLLNQGLNGLILETDLKVVYRRNVRKVKDELDDRARKVLTELGARRFGVKEIVGLLKIAPTVKSKKGEWFLDIYDYLKSKKDGPWRGNRIWKDIESLKFMRTSTGELIAPRDERRPFRLLTHYPQKKEIGNLNKIFDQGELVFLDKFFQLAKKRANVRVDPELEEKRRRVKDFLKEYGVEKLMEEYHIIDKVVLNSFDSGRCKRFSKKKLVIFTNFIRENMSLYANRIRSQRAGISDDKVFEDIRQRLLLKGFYFENGKRKEALFRPEELYFYKLNGKITEIYKLFKGIAGIPFLSPVYYEERFVKGYSTIDTGQRRGRVREIPEWDDFFRDMGVWSSPRLRAQDIYISEEDPKYKDIPFQHSTEGQRLLGDHYFPDIESLLDNMEGEKPQTKHSKMEIFLDLVGRSWDRVYKKRTTSRYRWFYYTQYITEVGFSSFIIQMKELKWMPSDNLPGLFRPRECYVGTAENKLLLSEDTPFVPNLHAYRAMYKATEVNDCPTTEHLLDYLIELKKSWKRENFPADWTAKMEAIYSFLNEVIQNDKDLHESVAILQKFKSEDLIFLPTERRNWWGIKKVYWNKLNKVFSWMRGYLSPEYRPELEAFFREIGVKQSPDLEDLVGILEEIKLSYQKKPSDKVVLELKGIIDPVYKEMSESLKEAIPNDATLNGNLFDKDIFLTSGDSFASPSALVYCDNEKFRQMFGENAKIIWLRSDWRKLFPLFKEAGINSFSSRVRVKMVKGVERDIADEEKEAINSLSEYIGAYIKYFDPSGYNAVVENNELQRISEMEVKLVSSLSLKHVFSPKGEKRRFTVTEPNAETHYEEGINTLHVLEAEGWLENFCDTISGEICKILESTSLPIGTQIESLLSAGCDEQLRDRKFASFGIPQDVLRDFIEPGEQRLRKGKKSDSEEVDKDGSETETDINDQDVEKGEKDVTRKPKPSDTFNFKEEELISIDEIKKFRFKKKGETSIDIDIERQKGKSKGKPKPGSRGGGGPYTYSKSVISKHETESRAIEIVEMYESERGRDPKDVRKDGVGYDVNSSERKIEVKSFKGSPGGIELYDSEYDAAKAHGKDFYIYVVYNMLKGSQPKIEIIREPLNSVVFVAEKRTAKNWKSAITEEVDVLGQAEK